MFDTLSHSKLQQLSEKTLWARLFRLEFAIAATEPGLTPHQRALAARARVRAELARRAQITAGPGP